MTLEMFISERQAQKVYSHKWIAMSFLNIYSDIVKST